VLCSLSIPLAAGLCWVGFIRSGRSVRTTELVIVDATGRALFRVGEDSERPGMGALQFLDANGTTQVAIGFRGASSPYIALKDREDGSEMMLGVDDHGASIALRNLKSRSGLLLGTDPTGIAALGIMDAEGRSLAEIAAGPDGSARLVIRSKDGTQLFAAP
jgi:hypothetical protein